MIGSILDQDTYKLTMQNAVCKLYPNAWVKYKFTDRNGTKYPRGFANELRKEVDKMGRLGMSEYDKQQFAQSCPFIDNVYLDFLMGYRFDPNEVSIEQHDNGELSVEIEGYWYRTILWEVPLLAIISELYHEMMGEHIDKDDEDGDYFEKLSDHDTEKFFNLSGKGIKIAEFGTRRRHSRENHERLISTISAFKGDPLIGSSNVELALSNGLKPIGTFAHEWVMGIGALKGYAEANKNAMEDWVRVYNGQLGIALTDTFGTDAFFKDFDTKYAKLFDGVRHDSGDEFEFADKVIKHYEKLGIDPTTKTIIFSDSLNPDKIEVIDEYCKGKIKASYGVGTNLTNDVGFKPLNIVIKLWEIDGNPTVKLSDDDGKHVGDEKTIESVKYLLNYGK